MISEMPSTLAFKKEGYMIQFSPNILHNEKALKSFLEPYSSRFAIITDEVVAHLYGNSLNDTLRRCGFESDLFSFPTGEKNKTRETKTSLENALLEKGLGRDIAIIALGGGVVTDLVGFLAATYTRGVPLIIIPTTLLGMVDASMGGKNGVNTVYGKNLIGTLYRPKIIIVDICTLKTLPPQEIRNGIVEMIKHGIIANKKYFYFLSDYYKEVLALDNSLLAKIIFESCQIKNDIVSQDEREKGKRYLLNFGHTIGHALEKISDYTLTHGEAVAIGLLVESYISMQKGFLNSKVFQQIKIIMEKYSFNFNIPDTITVEQMQKAMKMDKKTIKGQPRFAVIKTIGLPIEFEGAYCTVVEDYILEKALNWMIHDLCRH